MTEALDRLIKSVEAGFPHPTTWKNFSSLPVGDVDNPNTILAHHAYNGSLDAANALHEALLPGHWYKICSWPSLADRVAQVGDQYGRAEITSRAWLLAILRAHRAQIGGEG